MTSRKDNNEKRSSVLYFFRGFGEILENFDLFGTILSQKKIFDIGI